MQLTPTPRSRAADTPAIIPRDKSEAIVTWLALVSMAPFWRAVWPELNAWLPPIREAARNALYRRYEGGEVSDVAALFKAALPEGQRPVALGILHHIAALYRLEGVGEWRAWFSQHQHEAEGLGLSDPALAHTLTDRYRREVVRPARALRHQIAAEIPAEPMDDWDMWIHTAYDYHYQTDPDGEDSALLIEMAEVYRALLFNDFLRDAVAVLPAKDRLELWRAIRSDAGETLTEMVDGGDVLMTAMLVPGNDIRAIVDAIPPVEKVILR